jgi:hypothetical protein
MLPSGGKKWKGLVWEFSFALLLGDFAYWRETLSKHIAQSRKDAKEDRIEARKRRAGLSPRPPLINIT